MKRHRRHKKKVRTYSQCERCETKGCRESRREECAKRECMAIADGTVYECPDREPDYWERLEAA